MLRGALGAPRSTVWEYLLYMKTNIHYLSYIAQFVLERRLSGKFVEIIRTQI